MTAPLLSVGPLLTPAELRAALRLSRREYTRQVAQGMPVAFAAGRAKRFRLDDVLAWNQAVRQRAAARTDLVQALKTEARRLRAVRR